MRYEKWLTELKIVRSDINPWHPYSLIIWNFLPRSYRMEFPNKYAVTYWKEEQGETNLGDIS